MDIRKVKKLIEMLENSNLEEIEIQEGEESVRLVKGSTNATNTTKKVKKNSIFFGLQGTKVHGSKYIEEAMNLGASISVHDDPKYKSNKANVFYIDDLSKRIDMFTNKESEQKNRIYYSHK